MVADDELGGIGIRPGVIGIEISKVAGDVTAGGFGGETEAEL